MKIMVTGATGLLGRQIMEKGMDAGHDMLGIGFRRAGLFGYDSLDLTDRDSVEEYLAAKKPDCVIHSAAERHTDVVEHKPQRARALNVESTAFLGEMSLKYSFTLLYISTDFVFDGAHPPYKPDDATDPLNAYGKSKLTGEWFLADSNPDASVLRLPVLYGPTNDLNESSVTHLANDLMTHDEMTVDNWAIRYPTWTPDAGQAAMELAVKITEDSRIKGKFHFSGKEPLTKYQMMRVMAPLLHMDHKTFLPNDKPTGDVFRPHNSQLDCSRLKALGIDPQTSFLDGLTNLFETMGFSQEK